MPVRALRPERSASAVPPPRLGTSLLYGGEASMRSHSGLVGILLHALVALDQRQHDGVHQVGDIPPKVEHFFTAMIGGH